MRNRLMFVLLISSFFLVSGCSRKPDNQAQGYMEGRYTYMATSVSGKLEKILVKRGTKVKQGEQLFLLEQKPEIDAYRAALEILQESTAARDAIQANLVFAKLTFERYKVLVPKGAIQQSQLDNAKSIYNSTLAQLAQADATISEMTAAVAQAKWRLEQKISVAPLDAIVFDTYYRVGEFVEANKAIVSLLAPSDIKAIFYIPEVALGGVQLGDSVRVHCDRCAKAYEGKISFISPTAEFTPPIIYSTETNEKLIYRIEASFEPQDAYQLHPGQPVYVSYVQHKGKH